MNSCTTLSFQGACRFDAITTLDDEWLNIQDPSAIRSTKKNHNHHGCWQRVIVRYGSCSPIAIRGRLCRLGTARDEKSHGVPTLDGDTCAVTAASGQRRTATACAGTAGPSGDVGRAAKPPITALESGLEQTVAHHCWGSSTAAPQDRSWKSSDDVQKELQVAELEDELACMRLLYMARVARWVPPYVLATLQTGAAAAWRSAVVKDMERMSQLLSPKLDSLGLPREMPARWEEFMKTWLRQWQTLVALFAEKRRGVSESAALANLTGSSDDEFLCPDFGDVFPTLGRLKCHRGKAHKIRRPPARFVRGGVCPHCRVDLHCRTRAMVHLEKGARSCREAQNEGTFAGAHGGSAQRGRSRVGSISQTSAL